LLKHIWTESEVAFSGDFYELPRSLVEPKPVQSPHPPILVGGYAEATIRRAVTLADGYIGGNVPLSEVTPLLESLSEAAESHGRDPKDLQLVSRGSLRIYDTPQGGERRPLFGSVEEIRADIERYRESGLTELFLELNFDPSFADVDADPSQSLERALWLMEELKPAAS
jgi:alkanesulfonate monooxygenase SsuD/methylene tetrahydromethanopterin reductase-like flavin-dependent oxidoreductase (luciferase family)